MGLKDITLPEEKVSFVGGEFSVRGLDLDSVSYLVSQHGSSIEKAFKDLMKQDGALTPDSVAKFCMPLIGKLPGFISELIACAAGDLELAPYARKLPFPVQVEALEKIVFLTFSVAGGPKKFMETVLSLLQGTTGLLTSLQDDPKA